MSNPIAKLLPAWTAERLAPEYPNYSQDALSRMADARNANHFNHACQWIEKPDGEGYHVRITLLCGTWIEGAHHAPSHGRVRVDAYTGGQVADIPLAAIATIERID